MFKCLQIMCAKYYELRCIKKKFTSECWRVLIAYKLASFSVSGLKDEKLINKKAQLSLTNPRDAKACQNCSDSTCLQRCR